VDTLGPALESLRDKVEAALDECGKPVNLVSLAPGGTVSWDDCCGDGAPGGQLWVRVVSIIPQPAASQPCDITDLQCRVAVGVVRCMHGLKEGGEAPTAGEMDGDTLAMTGDADTVLRAIRTWGGTQFTNLKSLRVESGLPLGPQGYCGGWEWTLVFRLLMCAGC
jgi:hypothetical protein